MRTAALGGNPVTLDLARVRVELADAIARQLDEPDAAAALTMPCGVVLMFPGLSTRYSFVRVAKFRSRVRLEIEFDEFPEIQTTPASREAGESRSVRRGLGPRPLANLRRGPPLELVLNYRGAEHLFIARQRIDFQSRGLSPAEVGDQVVDDLFLLLFETRL